MKIETITGIFVVLAALSCAVGIVLRLREIMNRPFKQDFLARARLGPQRRFICLYIGYGALGEREHSHSLGSLCSRHSLSRWRIYSAYRLIH